jgi:hypothetical protein
MSALPRNEAVMLIMQRYRATDPITRMRMRTTGDFLFHFGDTVEIFDEEFKPSTPYGRVVAVHAPFDQDVGPLIDVALLRRQEHPDGEFDCYRPSGHGARLVHAYMIPAWACELAYPQEYSENVRKDDAWANLATPAQFGLKGAVHLVDPFSRAACGASGSVVHRLDTEAHSPNHLISCPQCQKAIWPSDYRKQCAIEAALKTCWHQYPQLVVRMEVSTGFWYWKFAPDGQWSYLGTDKDSIASLIAASQK